MATTFDFITFSPRLLKAAPFYTTWLFLHVCISIVFVLVIAWVAVKFGINTTSVVLEMGINFTRRSQVKFTISNTTRVVFIPNFIATHAIPS